MIQLNSISKNKHVAIIGAGFTGLSAAYELERRGIRTTVFEKSDEIGGMAGSSIVEGAYLENFYHHFFPSDNELIQLIHELGLEENIVGHKVSTGIYLRGNFFRLSTPLDVLCFKPLSLMNRIRLGLLVVKARKIKNWQELDNLTATDWLKSLCGNEVFRVAWEPLLKGKFGEYASEISAAWFWRKITKRGVSRDKKGSEKLLYLKGSFSVITERLAKGISKVHCNDPIEGIIVRDNKVRAIISRTRIVACDAIIATQPLPNIADIICSYVDDDYIKKLRQIEYLANVCLVLELDRKLSQMYWINVNDLSFPFVGIIEHTNMVKAATYGGNHIIYLSKYLKPDSEIYQMDDKALMEYSLPHLHRLFPHFKESWIKTYHVWKAKHAQPLVKRNFRKLIPDKQTPISGFYISTMAQIYPEDRGVNYAIHDGRDIARRVEIYFNSERHEQKESGFLSESIKTVQSDTAKNSKELNSLQETCS